MPTTTMNGLQMISVLLSVVAAASLLTAVKSEGVSGSVLSEGEWRSVGLADDGVETTMEVVFALTHSPAVRAALEQTCKAVSSPESPVYGNYLDGAAVRAMVSNKAAGAAVQQWLAKEAAALGFAAPPVALGALGDLARTTLPVAVVNHALGVQVHTWEHVASAAHRVLRAAGMYTIPEELHGVVQSVGGVAQFELSAVRTKLHRRGGHATTPATPAMPAAPAAAPSQTAPYFYPPILAYTAVGNGTAVAYVNQVSAELELELELAHDVLTCSACMQMCTNGTGLFNMSNSVPPCARDGNVHISHYLLRASIDGAPAATYR